MSPDEVQQTPDAASGGTQVASNNAAVPSPVGTLPLELLQSVFHHLSLYDLIRCQGVCRAWRNYLPGDDPALHRKLHLRAKAAGPSDDVRIEVFVTRDDHLTFPISFRLTIIFWYPESSMKLHPIIVNWPAGFGFAIRPRFISSYNSPPSPSHFYAEARSYIWNKCRYMEEDSVSTDVRPSWEQMLLCAPAVQQLKVTTRRPSNNGYHNPERTLSAEEGSAGVTLGQVMHAVREELSMAQSAMGIGKRYYRIL